MEETARAAHGAPTTEPPTEQHTGRDGHGTILVRFGDACDGTTAPEFRPVPVGNTGTLVGVAEPDRIEELSALFTSLADTDLAGYSPLYERITRRTARDRGLLELIADSASPSTRRGRVPVLYLAALHDLALGHPTSELAAAMLGAGVDDDRLAAAIDRALVDHREEFVTTMRTRSVQTNEVGRSAPIVAGLAALTASGVLDGRPIALVELGPSAGLNLFADRWTIDFARDGALVHRAGPPDSPVHLRCELRGPHTPSAFTCAPIASRTGVDPEPIDAGDPTQTRWLRACVWPDVPERPQRLAAALEAVRPDPPALVRGDAVTDLAPVVSAVAADRFPVVVSTWALAYLSADGRDAVVGGLESIAAERDLALLTLEEPRFTPWLDPHGAEVTAAGDGTPTMLGLRVWRDGSSTATGLAMAHPHGTWMHWLAGAPS